MHYERLKPEFPKLINLVADQTTRSYEKDKGTQTDDPLLTSSECASQNKYFISVPDLANCSNYYELCSYNSNLSKTQFMSLNLTNVKSCPKGTVFDSLDTRCVKMDNAYCGG